MACSYLLSKYRLLNVYTNEQPPPVVVPIRNTYVPSLGLLFKKYSVEHNLLVLRIASYLSRILYHIIMIV